MQRIDQGKKPRELENDQILNHSEQVNTTVFNGSTINAIVNDKNRVKVKRGTLNNHILENNNNDKIVCRQIKSPSTSACPLVEAALQVPEIPNDEKGVYIVAQVELKITCVKTQIREVHDLAFNQTETFNVIEHFAVGIFYKELKGFLLYISVLSWYTNFLLEHEIIHGSDSGASLKMIESPYMKDVDVNEALGNYSCDDTDDEDIKDTYECGRCKAKFQSLDSFMSHKMSCKVKKTGKKVTKSDADSEDLTTQFRYTLSTDDEHVMNDIQKMIKENTDKFTTTNMGNDFYEKGSLVIWGKMNTSVTKNRESVKKCMEVFVVNMLENCQINSEKETKVTVKLDILKEIEGCEDDDEDVFCCGRCNKLFNRIDTFSSHKKECNRRARLLRTIRQKELLSGEKPRTVEAQCNSSEQTIDPLKTKESSNPIEIGLSLYPDESKKYYEQLQNIEPSESGKVVLRQMRKKKKKKPSTSRKPDTDDSDTSFLGSESNFSTISSSTDSGFDTDRLTNLTQDISEDMVINSDYSEGSMSSADEKTLKVLQESSKVQASSTDLSEPEETGKYEDLNFYQRSKKGLDFELKDDLNLIKFGLDLSPSCVNDLSSHMKRHKKEYYEDLILDNNKLQILCRNEPSKYKRGIIEIEASHMAKCTVSDKADTDVIEISGRSKCGKAYTEDEVVIEILGREISSSNTLRMEKKKQVGKTYGKVVGLLKRTRCRNMDYPVFICEIDEHEMDKAKPICKTMPKLHLVRDEKELKPYTVDIYKYKKRKRILEFQESLTINKHLIKAYLFYVVCLSWEKLQYPMGAIFKVHHSTQNYIKSMRILDLQYKIPSEYEENTMESTNNLLQMTKEESLSTKLSNRRDLTGLNIFTIDPEKSKVFDDAIHIREVPGDCTKGLRNAEHYEVGVHITDVASIVKLNSAMDIEALQRGTTYFPGQFLFPHHMLPEPISEDICCLLPEQERPTLTVFLYFNINKEILFDKTKLCKSTITSRAKLSYREVQNMIDNPEYEHALKTEIKQLYEISKTIRKKRLGNAALSVPVELNLPGEGDSDAFDAYYLIEEFMILTNYMVGILIKRNFPDCVPLRCQDSPSIQKVNDWLTLYPNISDIILQLQGRSLAQDRRLSMANIGETVRNDILPVQSWVWNSFVYSVRDENFTAARVLLGSDELHPMHALALHDWETIQETAVYRCSGTSITTERHYSLNITPYVHFTAPIRRYIDIVAQRLFHAAIDKEQSPYSSEQIKNMCVYVNNVSRNAQIYRSKCQELVFASIVVKEPFMTHGFVDDFTEDEIRLIIPGLKFVQSQHKSISISHLHVCAPPQTIPDTDIVRRTVEKNRLVLKWKKRIYSIKQMAPKGRNPKSGYVRSTDEYQKIHPHQNANFHKVTTWVHYLKLLTSGANSSQLKRELSLDRLRAGFRDRYLPSAFNTELDINSELQNPNTRENGNDHVMFPEQFSLFSFSFSHGQCLAVQMSAVMRNGLLIPVVDLLSLTHGIKCCLKHMRDPVSCFESYSTVKSKDNYATSQEYKDTWIPIILMESAFSVVRESGILINDVNIRFQQRNGVFTLRTEFCFERCLDIKLITTSFLDDQKKIYERESDIKTGVSDYLCIRCPINYGEGVRFLGQKLHCRHYFWLGHAKITRVIKIAKDTPDERIKVFFELTNDDIVPEAIRYKDIGVKCSIELLQRIESNKRVEASLLYLNRADITLPKSIALNKQPPDIDEKYANLVKCDIEIGLPENNKMQTKAIRIALRSSFSLIHGPPGTGKTNTGIKLIHLFHKINQLRLKDVMESCCKIIYCGPSNKSVDLVARRLMKHSIKGGPSIVRFYGTSIEQLVYEVPGKGVFDNKGSDYKPDEAMNNISLHYLIRTTGQYAREISAYEENFKRKASNITLTKVKEYKKLLSTATEEELSKHDVIFCTTSMVTSPRLIKATRDNVSQLIVDECGMCTEPECMATIIASKPEQVVLIGDHKQLRPIVMCKQAADLGLERSLFERYSKTARFVQLNMQYRMHDSICNFPSGEFYEGSLQTAESPSYVENPRLSIWLNDQGLHRKERHIFSHVEGTEEYVLVSTESENEHSCSNKIEVDQVIKIFKHLCYNEKIFNRGEKSCTLNIMSQYNAQCQEIKQALAREKLDHSEIHTVVSSQGGEWDYVIFSLVRSLPDYRIEPHPTKGWCKENLGFITDHNQINVALTRARKGLFIIGNKHLLTCDQVWKNLITEYESKGCVIDGANFPKEVLSANKKRKASKKNP
ncbi:3'-5' exoribonuclease HELZ2-like [Mytilus trossulus]|uniref:3'-5' exoribonuclease HELZ2-like n=1 Tax=Mytilus trossulus TaxID=6551 RepID=UPI003006F1A5